MEQDRIESLIEKAFKFLVEQCPDAKVQFMPNDNKLMFESKTGRKATVTAKYHEDGTTEIIVYLNGATWGTDAANMEIIQNAIAKLT